MTIDELDAFALDHAAAWRSRDAASVVAHFSEDAVVQVNDGPLHVGHAAIRASVQSFMDEYPVIGLITDGLVRDGAIVHWHWTLVGRQSGRGGTGAPVRLQGSAAWRFGDDALLVESKARYDAADYEAQLAVR
jgi:ketosteroid isomerase-like protein